MKKKEHHVIRCFISKTHLKCRDETASMREETLRRHSVEGALPHIYWVGNFCPRDCFSNIVKSLFTDEPFKSKV